MWWTFASGIGPESIGGVDGGPTGFRSLVTRAAAPSPRAPRHDAPGGSGDRARGRAGAARPDHDRRLRGLERRRRGRDARPSSTWLGRLGRRAGRRARPRGLLRLPGQPAAGSARRRRPPPDHLADHPDPAGARRPAPTATSSWSHGIEPSMRWRSFAIELLEFAQAVGVSSCSSRSARCWPTCRTPGRIPITATSERRGHDPAATTSRRASYEGPTGIVGVLAGRRRPGRPARRCRCWAAVPHYAGGTPSPKATLGAAAPARGAARHHRSRTASCPSRRGPGSTASTSWPSPTTRWPSTSRRLEQAQGHRRPARGQRRRHRAGVRALPAPARRRAPA